METLTEKKAMKLVEKWNRELSLNGDSYCVDTQNGKIRVYNGLSDDLYPGSENDINDFFEDLKTSLENREGKFTKEAKKMKLVQPINTNEESALMSEVEYKEFLKNMAFDYDCTEEEIAEGYNVTDVNVKSAKNLDELCESVNAIREAGLDYQIDMANLPVFGDYDGDTMGIFSWDDKRLLIQGTNGFEIIGRNE